VLSSPPGVPASLVGLVDDATALAAGGAGLEAAVVAHHQHRSAAYAALVGPFVVGDRQLPRLDEQVAGSACETPLPVGVVVSGGAGALEPAVAWAAQSGHLRLCTIQIALRESDAGDLAPNASRIVTAVDRLVDAGTLEEDVAVHVEPPRLHGADPSASWLGALDEVAAVDHRLVLRTAGAEPDDVPSPRELATCIGAALDRELRFACAGGPHRAVRHRNDNGAAEHGFLNVLLATRASLDGAGIDDVAAALELGDPEAVLGSVEPSALASARRWFTSCGSRDVPGAVCDLTVLGLLAEP